MFTTIEPPEHLDIAGRGCLLQAKVLRLKKDLKVIILAEFSGNNVLLNFFFF